MCAYKILLTDGLEKEGREILEKSAQVDNLKDITAEDLLQKIGEYDAVIVRGRTKLTPEVFGAATKLKVTGRAGVGVDNINLEAAKAKGVVVVNSPLATTIAVAELTLGLMLWLIRDIPRADAGLKEGNWLEKRSARNRALRQDPGCDRIWSALVLPWLNGRRRLACRSSPATLFSPLMRSGNAAGNRSRWMIS